MCTRKYPVLDGTGAKLNGGRWNSPGRSVVYTASCGALAALEYRVHAAEMPVNLILARIEVPDTLKIEELPSLPADPGVFRQIGDEWLQHNGSPALRVPSVLVPRQWNLLLNPDHPLFPAIQVIDQAPFAFDLRLLSANSNP
jgi:RES domain-containing protein